MHGRTLRRLAVSGFAAALSILTLVPAMPGLLVVAGVSPALAALSPSRADSNPLAALEQAAGGTAAGAIPGSLHVGQDGSANYTIPIDVPPGTNGAQPSLALTYNSNDGNGILGIGWSLAGLSSITRCPATPALNGKVSEGGVGHRAVRYDKDDRFCLGGMQLKLMDDSPAPYGVDGSRYQPAISSGLQPRVTAMGICGIDADHPQGRGPCAFMVEHPDGSIDYYGATHQLASGARDYSDSYGADPAAWGGQSGAVKNGSQLPVNTETADTGESFDSVMHKTVRQWNLARTVDPHGNYVDYIYVTPVRISTQDHEGTLVGKSYIWEIRYTGNKGGEGLDHSRRIRFHYNFDHVDGGFAFGGDKYEWHGTTSYVGGFPVAHSGAALKRISTSVARGGAWTDVRTYTLTYDADEGEQLQYQRGIRLFAIEVCASDERGTQCLPETRLTWNESRIGYVRSPQYQLPDYLVRLTARDATTKAAGTAVGWLAFAETLAWLAFPFLPEIGGAATLGLIAFDALQAFDASPIGPHVEQTWLNSLNHPAGRENMSAGQLIDIDGDSYLDFLRLGGTLSNSHVMHTGLLNTDHDVSSDPGIVVYGGPKGFTGEDSETYPWVVYPHPFSMQKSALKSKPIYTYSADKHRTVDFYKRARHGVIVDVDSDGRPDYVDENGVIHYNGGRGHLNVPGKVTPLVRMKQLEEFMPLHYWRKFCTEDPGYWLCKKDAEGGAKSKAPAPGQLFTYFHLHGKNLDGSNWSAVEYPLATLVDMDGDGLKDWVETTCSWGVRTQTRSSYAGRYFQLADRKRLLGNVFGPIYRDWGATPPLPKKRKDPFYDLVDPHYATQDNSGSWQLRKCAVYRQTEPRRFSKEPDFYLPGPLFTYALYPWGEGMDRSLIEIMYEPHLPEDADSNEVDGPHEIRARDKVIINQPAKLVDMDGDGIPDYCYVAKSSDYWNFDWELAVGVAERTEDGNVCYRGLGRGDVAGIGFESTPFLHFRTAPDEPYLNLAASSGVNDVALDYGSWNPRQLIDMNADGLLDIIETECTMRADGLRDNRCRIFLNTGRLGEDAFVYAGNLPGPLAHSPDELDVIAQLKALGEDVEARDYDPTDKNRSHRNAGERFVWRLGFLIDINGDRLPDWTDMRTCTTKPGDPAGIQRCDVRLNIGHDHHTSDAEMFATAVSLPLPKFAIDPDRVPDVFESNLVAGGLLDVNGDSFTDIAPGYCVQTPFAEQSFYLPNDLGNLRSESIYACGDGGSRDTYLSTLRYPKVERIDNGAGLELAIEYRRASDPDVYAMTADRQNADGMAIRPRTALVFATHTKIAEQRDKGVVERDFATRYHYENYRVSREFGRLGFETVTSWSVDGENDTDGSGKGVRIVYHQEFPHIGAPRYEMSFIPAEPAKDISGMPNLPDPQTGDPSRSDCMGAREQGTGGRCIQLADGSRVVPVSESYTKLTTFRKIATDGGGRHDTSPVSSETIWVVQDRVTTSTGYEYAISMAELALPDVAPVGRGGETYEYLQLMPRSTIRVKTRHVQNGLANQSHVWNYGALCGEIDTNGDSLPDVHYHCVNKEPTILTSTAQFRVSEDSWVWLPAWTDTSVDGEKVRRSTNSYAPAGDGEVCDGPLARSRKVRTTIENLDTPETTIAGSLTTARTLDCYGNVVRRQVAPDIDGSGHGAVTTFKYDESRAFPVTATVAAPGDGAAGFTTSSTYDLATGNVLSTTDSNGYTQSHEYDPFGRLMRVCVSHDPYGGTPLSESERNHGRRLCGGEPMLWLGDVWQEQDGALLETWTYQLVDRGDTRRDFSSTHDFSMSRSTHDALGRNAGTDYRHTRNGMVVTSNVIYDDRGRLSRQSLPHELGKEGTWRTVKYDYRNRVVEQRTPVKEDGTVSITTTTYRMDEDRNMVVESWQNRGTPNEAYLGKTVTDVHGRVVREQSPPDTKETRHEYDALGQLVRTTDPVGVTTTYHYDSLGRVYATEDGNTGRHVVLEYDAFGKPRVVERNGKRIRLERDAFGRVVKKVLPPTFVDDGDGSGDEGELVVGGRVVKYYYGGPEDAAEYRAGRLYRIENWVGDPDDDPEGAELALAREFDYTIGGAVAAKRLEFGPGAVEGDKYQGGYEERYEYTVAGTLKSITYPDGKSLSLSRNADGFLDSAWWNENPYHDAALAGQEEVFGSGNPVVRYDDYNLLGEAATTIYGNGFVETRRYDPVSGLLNLQDLVDGDGISRQKRTYWWNPSHQLYRRSVDYNDGLDNEAPSRVLEVFVHDELGRLTSVHEQVATGWQVTGIYNYNDTGDMRAKTELSYNDWGARTIDQGDLFALEPESHRIEQITHHGGNITDIRYDANGNLIGKKPDEGTEWRYVFDVENRLLQVDKRQVGSSDGFLLVVPAWQPVARYQYDETGQRVRKLEFLDGGVVTDYVSKRFEITRKPYETLCTKYVHGLGGIVQQVTEPSGVWAAADTPCAAAVSP